MIEIGKVEGSDCPLIVSDAASNRHILITGGSGTGKSTALKQMEIQMSREGKRIIVLNVNGTHEDVLNIERKFHVVRVKDEGVPFPLLECLSFPNGMKEDPVDVSEAVVEVFSQADRMGYRQKYLLRVACERAIASRENYSDDMHCLLYAINSLEDDAGEVFLEKYGVLLKRVKFGTEADLWSDDKVTILDFSGYPQRTQILIAQLALSVLWRQHRVSGQQEQEETWVVVDEFQNFSLKEDSVLTQILREGRKFKLSLILATQTLAGFDVKQRAVLQQPATKLYFKPVETDLRKIANIFPDMDIKEASNILRNLRIGECLVSGEFLIGGKKQTRALRSCFPKLY
ncbi:MAG: DUF853 family protein [Lachnospiraceae bacterium]|nr:DUF853 family protein [Lachnospiraceae bacterium]